MKLNGINNFIKMFEEQICSDTADLSTSHDITRRLVNTRIDKFVDVYIPILREKLKKASRPDIFNIFEDSKLAELEDNSYLPSMNTSPRIHVVERRRQNINISERIKAQL